MTDINGSFATIMTPVADPKVTKIPGSKFIATADVACQSAANPFGVENLDLNNLIIPG